MCFRVLLELADKPGGVVRESETSPACRATRKVLCALRDDADTKTYVLTQSGPINAVTRLMGPMKGQYLHAVVSWRHESELTLVSFSLLEPDFVTEFRQIFEKEVEVCIASGGDAKRFTLPADEVSTPNRTETAAKAASALLAPPRSWANVTTP